MKLLGPPVDFEGQADAVQRRADRATPRRSTACPAQGFDTILGGRSDRAARRPDHGHAARRSSLDPAQNNTFRAINRAWKSGATVQFAERRDVRYVIADCRDAQQAIS